MLKFLTGGSQGDSNTGLNEEAISGLIITANADAQAAVDELGAAMQKILDVLGEEWGTQDSISDVDTDILPGLNTAQQQVAAELKAVVQTVRETALKQASDTNNDFSGLPTADDPTLPTLSNKQTSVLADIGLVGVKGTLEADVASAGSSAQELIDAKLDDMNSHLQEAAALGFVDAGNTVQTKLAEHYGNVKSALDQALTTLMESVNTYTTGVVKYEQDIQGEWVQIDADGAQVGGGN